MRIDDARPRTWLLAAVAGWAVLAWVLAIAGMGGRVAPLAVEPSLLEPLPRMRAAPVARPGPLSGYAEIAARPLFSPDRTPQPFYLEGNGGEGTTQGFDYVLTSVLLTPQVQLAILQPPDGSASFRVRLNQGPTPHPAWHLVELDERSAVFDGPEGRRTLQLRVFDGVGGESPSVIGGADGAAEPGLPADNQPAAPAQPPIQAPTSESAQRGSEPVVATDADQPTAGAAQMDAIRQRIQARREAMRNPPQPEPPANNR